MTTVNYYIEDLATGLVVMENGQMLPFLPEGHFDENEELITIAKTFGSHQHALEFVDTLPAGEYRIFSRIVKAEII